MEKQSLIKYYCALFLVVVLLAGVNNAIAQTPLPDSTLVPKAIATASPTITQSSEKTKVESNNSMLFPVILSIFALTVSGGAIALSIFKNKEVDRRIDSLKKKYNDDIKLLDNKYTELLAYQKVSSVSQPQKSISCNSPDNNAYLEATIERNSERISELENKLQISQHREQFVDYSKKSSYSPVDVEPSFNPFEQNDELLQYNTQPTENLAYIELVNTYNNNPKLLEQTAIKVSEPTDSINRRRSDSSQKIFLEKANNSNYWVIHDVGTDCWLLPKSKLRIDQFRYETTKALFECRGYHPEYTTFNLVKPAKVTPLSTDDRIWQLEESGILEFSVEV